MTLQPKRLAEEGVPIAAILFFWHLLATVASIQNVGGPVRAAGVVMAALYVAVRGAALSPEVLPAATDDLRVVLYENARLAVPAGAWFLGAVVVAAVESYVHEFTWVIASVGDALAGAGLGVVALYAVAVGVTTLGGGDPGDSRGSDRTDADSNDETPADD